MTATIGEQVIELRFNPAELRDPHGEWTKGGVSLLQAPSVNGVHEYRQPDHARLINPRGHPPDPADHQFFKDHPASYHNIVAAWDSTAATPGLRAQGMRWYSDVHNLAKYVGQGDPKKGAILLATYSPQASWPVNMFNAARSGELGRALGPGEGLITGDMQRKGNLALSGADFDDVLKPKTSPKTNNFARLIALGDDEPGNPYGHVVVDTHALNVALGGHVRGDALKKAPISDPRYHEYIADMYRQAAAEISKRDGKLVTPYQMQAVTWLAQQAANQAVDAAQASQTATAKGRVAMTKNAWARWMAYAKDKNIPLVTGTTSLTAQLLGQVIEMMAPESITGQVIELDFHFNPAEPRDAAGRWTKASDAKVAGRPASPHLAKPRGVRVTPQAELDPRVLEAEALIKSQALKISHLETAQHQQTLEIRHMMTAIRDANQHLTSLQEKQEDKKTRLQTALHIATLVAGAVITGITGGLGAPLLIAIAAGLTPAVTQEVIAWRKHLQ